MSTYDKIINIFKDRLNLHNADTIQPEATFKDLDIDSLDFLEVITEIELQFGITIPDEDLADFENVGQAVRYLEDLVDKG